MPTLSLTINNAPVRFRSTTTEGAIEQFAFWMRGLKQEHWRVDTAISAEGDQTRLRCRQDRAVGDEEPRRRWVVAQWVPSRNISETPSFDDPGDALRQFCAWLPKAGEIWQEAAQPRTVVTLIFPDPDIIPAEPRAEDVAAGVRWMWTLLDQHATLTSEKRFARIAMTTALHHLNRNEYSDAREALAALNGEPGIFDYAALPAAVRSALERVSQSMLLEDDDLQTNIRALLDLVGLGLLTEADRPAVQPI